MHTLARIAELLLFIAVADALFIGLLIGVERWPFGKKSGPRITRLPGATINAGWPTTQGIFVFTKDSEPVWVAEASPALTDPDWLPETTCYGDMHYLEETVQIKK